MIEQKTNQSTRTLLVCAEKFSIPTTLKRNVLNAIQPPYPGQAPMLCPCYAHAHAMVPIKRPNCALDRRTVLSLSVAVLYRQIFEHVSKCKWTPLTKIQGIPRTNTCHAKFVGTFNPYKPKLNSRFEFHNCKWIPQKLT